MRRRATIWCLGYHGLRLLRVGGGIDGKSCHHDTLRIAWAKLLARVGEAFPLACPNCGGDIRLISFITDLRPIRKILTYLGEPLDPPRVSPARARRTPWANCCSFILMESSCNHHRKICPLSTLITAGHRCRSFATLDRAAVLNVIRKWPVSMAGFSHCADSFTNFAALHEVGEGGTYHPSQRFGCPREVLRLRKFR
jgi:hypothetical protein